MEALKQKETILNIAGEWEEVDTTTPEWQKYYAELEHFQNYMKAKKPHPATYETLDKYKKALSEWAMAYSCDAPNKPNYFKANND